MRTRTGRPSDKYPPTSSDILTLRETEVLRLVGHGKTNREIADELGISREAVRFHLKELHSKLETDGQRGVLSRLGKFAGLFMLPRLTWHGFGQITSIVGVAMVGTTLGLLAYLSNVDEGGRNDATQRTVTYTTWEGASLGDFAVPGRISIDAIQALNPGLGLGILEPGIEVVVPLLSGGEMVEVRPTPPSDQ